MSETGASEEIVVPDDQQEAVAQALGAAGEKNDGIGTRDALHRPDTYIAAAIRLATQKLLQGVPITMTAPEVKELAFEMDPAVTDNGESANAAAQQVLQLVRDTLKATEA